MKANSGQSRRAGSGQWMEEDRVTGPRQEEAGEARYPAHSALTTRRSLRDDCTRRVFVVSTAQIRSNPRRTTLVETRFQPWLCTEVDRCSKKGLKTAISG